MLILNKISQGSNFPSTPKTALIFGLKGLDLRERQYLTGLCEVLAAAHFATETWLSLLSKRGSRASACQASALERELGVVAGQWYSNATAV